MDWNEALAAVQDNPEYQAIVKRLAGSESALNKEGSTSADVMNSMNRQADVADASSHLPSWDKSAQDSAQAMDEAQGFSLQGEPTSSDPNFKLKGKPYGSNELAVRDADLALVGDPYGNLPAVSERDVTPRPTSDHGSTFDLDEPVNAGDPELPTKSGGLSTKAKVALGVGAAGTGALGYEALKSDDDIPSDTHVSMPARQPASPNREDEAKEDELSRIASKEKETTATPVEVKNAPDKSIDEIGGNEQQNFPTASQPSGPDLNFGNQDQNKNLIDKALQDRQDAIKNAQWQRGVEQLSGGIARIAPNYGQSDIMQKQVNLPIEDYQLRQQAQENDPNSGISMGMRDYIKKLGINVSDGATAAQLKSVVPMIYKDQEAKQAQAAHHEDLALKQQSLGIQKQQLQATHEQMREDKLNKQSQDQATKMDQQASSVRGNKSIQDDMGTIRRAQNAMSIIQQYKNPNDIPPQIITGLNTDLGTIMQGGVGSEGIIHELSNNTYMSRLANGAQNLLNHPQGAQAAAFVNQNKMIFNTLANDAQGRIDNRFRQIGNTLGHKVDVDNREAYRRTYLPNDLYDPKTNDFVPSHKGVNVNVTPEMKTGAQAEIDRRMKAQGNQ